MNYYVYVEKIDSNSYDMIITIFPGKQNDSYYEEFSYDFSSPIPKLRMVKFILGGVIAVSIPFSQLAFAKERYSMTYLSYGSYQQQMEYVALSNGSFSVISPSYFNILSDGSLSIEEISNSYVQAMHQKNIKIVPFLSNHWDRTAGMLALDRVESLAAQIAEAVEVYQLDGINVDIENVTHPYRERYTQLVRLLRQKIPSHKEVSVAVAANPNGWNSGWHGVYDYRALGEIADHIFIMAYDEHFNGGEAGPVASIDFVERSIQYALTYVKKEKIVLGIPFFGRFWSHDGNIKGMGITSKQIETVLKKTNSRYWIDEKAKSATAEFYITSTDNIIINGQKLLPGTYTMWFDNSDTLKHKLSLVDKYGLKGAGSWSVGQETPDVWDYYSLWLNGKYFSDIFYHFAKDDILKINDENLMLGTGGDKFSPDEGMTRGQAAVILCRYLKIPLSHHRTTHHDINGHWAEKEIRAVVQKGLMSGYPDGNFHPNKAITREEIAVILQRAMQYEFSDGVSFSDVQKERWSYREITALVNLGILNGYPDGSFQPEKFLSRGEMAHLLRKLSDS